MFVSIPKELQPNVLSGFNFGDPEAKEDPLLQSSFCNIKPVQEFLEMPGKSIVLGERGSGKSALFRLIKDGNLAFKNDGKLKQVYVAIDEDLEYFGLNEFLNRSIKDSSGKATERFRIAWELFILNRVITELKEKFKNEKDLELIESEFAKSIGLDTSSKSTLLELLKTNKKTFGVKIEGGHLGWVIPNFYTSLEPSSSASPTPETSVMLDTGEIKSKIREFLKRQKAVVFVLIDKLDEFVVTTEYASQKLNLQALLETQRSYQAYSELKIKLFLRTDLFKRLDFESLGYDKVAAKTVELKWSDTDIRRFIARRIFINMSSFFGQKKFGFNLDDKKLYIDREYLEKSAQIDSEYTDKRNNVFYKIKKRINEWKISRSLKRRDNYDARKTDLTDEINKAVITLFFPRDVNHYNKKKQKISIDIFQFLNSHLSLASGVTTPRIVLMYFQKALENTREYYSSNPDTRVVRLNEKCEYPLFQRDSMLAAYQQLQDLMWETFVNLSARWKTAAQVFRRGLPDCSKATVIGYPEIKKVMTGHLIDEDLVPFIAFYTHVGLLKCQSPHSPEEKRTYELPILFQKLV